MRTQLEMGNLLKVFLVEDKDALCPDPGVLLEVKFKCNGIVCPISKQTGARPHHEHYCLLGAHL